MKQFNNSKNILMVELFVNWPPRACHLTPLDYFFKIPGKYGLSKQSTLMVLVKG